MKSHAHQPFVPEDESGMWFVGDGRDCNPDVTKYSVDDDIEAIVTSCLYYAARSATDLGTPARPTFDAPLLVARAQVHKALPCQYGLTGSDPDVGKITGLGEPSVTKDAKLLFFAYIRKLASGEPISPNHVPTACDTDDTPSDPGQPLCSCVEDDEDRSPKGCWLPDCEFTESPDPSPGGNCKERCNLGHLDGTDTDECLPASVLYCANPGKSQSLTDSSSSGYGVDVSEFNIGAARRESWDPSVAVIAAPAQ